MTSKTGPSYKRCVHNTVCWTQYDLQFLLEMFIITTYKKKVDDDSETATHFATEDFHLQ